VPVGARRRGLATGVAIRWDDTYVVIQLSDPELAGKYVYVQAQDVKRANDWSRPD
jgi:hypothetical protein